MQPFAPPMSMGQPLATGNFPGPAAALGPPQGVPPGTPGAEQLPQSAAAGLSVKGPTLSCMACDCLRLTCAELGYLFLSNNKACMQVALASSNVASQLWKSAVCSGASCAFQRGVPFSCECHLPQHLVCSCRHAASSARPASAQWAGAAARTARCPRCGRAASSWRRAAHAGLRRHAATAAAAAIAAAATAAGRSSAAANREPCRDAWQPSASARARGASWARCPAGTARSAFLGHSLRVLMSAVHPAVICFSVLPCAWASRAMMASMLVPARCLESADVGMCDHRCGRLRCCRASQCRKRRRRQHSSSATARRWRSCRASWPPTRCPMAGR